jgi:GMP reductase
MKIEEDIKLDFNDVLIRPKRSTLSSRSQVCLERTLTFVNSGQTWTGVPILSSNMDTIGTYDVYKVLVEHKMITVFHKFYSVDDYVTMSNEGLNKEYFMVSTGISSKDLERLNQIMEAIDVKFICIDVANGYMERLVSFCEELREKYPDTVLVAGNVVTREITEELILRGKVDVVKCGIGSGSACETRLKSGIGYPQLSCVMETSDAAHGVDGQIISDGGITCPGDVVKAFGAGADFVMIGGRFAGHDENPGDLEEDADGNKFKIFYGMSSDTAMLKHYGKKASYRSSEGRTVRIKYKGALNDTVEDYLGGIRSACTYINASFIKNIPKCTTFLRVNRQLNTIYA